MINQRTTFFAKLMHADSSRERVRVQNLDDKNSTPIKGEMHENTIPSKEKSKHLFP